MTDSAGNRALKTIEEYFAAKRAESDNPFETVDGKTYLKHDRIDFTQRNDRTEIQFYYGNKPTVLMHVGPVVAGQPVTINGIEGRQGVTFS